MFPEHNNNILKKMLSMLSMTLTLREKSKLHPKLPVVSKMMYKMDSVIRSLAKLLLPYKSDMPFSKGQLSSGAICLHDDLDIPTCKYIELMSTEVRWIESIYNIDLTHIMTATGEKDPLY